MRTGYRRVESGGRRAREERAFLFLGSAYGLGRFYERDFTRSGRSGRRAGFAGTRVPVRSLLDHLEGGATPSRIFSRAFPRCAESR